MQLRSGSAVVDGYGLFGKTTKNMHDLGEGDISYDNNTPQENINVKSP